jgi:hypothetical protein
VSPRGLPLILLLFGCAREEYRNADLQLDILAPQPAWADRVRVCVEGVRARTFGAGAGRYAVPGLPVGELAEVTVQVIVEAQDPAGETGLEQLIAAGSTARVSLSESTPWLETELELYAHSAQEALDCTGCPEPCHTDTQAAESEEESWLLATRFQD